MKKSKKSGLIAVLLLLVLVAAAAVAYFVFVPQIQPSADVKTVSVTVIHADSSEKVFTLETQAETLGQALDEAGLIEGEEGPYGLYILGVDGEIVDESKQQWWCLTKGGQQHNQGIDSTVLSDGDAYELTFTEGW